MMSITKNSKKKEENAAVSDNLLLFYSLGGTLYSFQDRFVHTLFFKML